MDCATQGEKAAIIKELREKGYKLKHLLKAIHMAKSTYYFELSKKDAVAKSNRVLLEEIFSCIKGGLLTICCDMILNKIKIWWLENDCQIKTNRRG